MRVRHTITAVAAAFSMAGIATTPAQALPGGMSGAEKLRRLDIMLMVTGLRCRTTPDNFQPDYQRFTARHIAELNAAAGTLRREMAVRVGAGGADRALDRLSVTMANAYGQGHPWLDCRQLKLVARNLADAEGGAVLEASADQLLAEVPGAQWALARR